MGLHQCSSNRVWTPEEKRMFQDISSRIADALSATLFYRTMEQNQERLRHLSTQLFRAQEEERKRIAEEIHDELGQATLAIKMGVENVLFIMGDDASDSIRNPLKSASNLANEMVQKMRRMQTSLYPPTLRDFGAITAINGLLDNYTNIYTEIAVKRSIRIKEEAIPNHLRITIFRIAQEALYNVARHSQTRTVTVFLNRLGCQLILKIIDNGIGFEPTTTIRYPDKRLGLGLTGMRERAEMTNGIFEISSAPNKGTTIRASWTLPQDQNGYPCG
jgi:signal transduction histidine kinase